MYVIKYIDKKLNRIKEIKTKFNTSDEASKYIDNEMKNIKEVWIDEELKTPKKNINLSEFIGCWAWVYSEREKEHFPYGIVRECNKQFIRVQTTPDQVEEDFCLYRIERFKDMIANDKLLFKKNGQFVIIKDFL